MDWALDRTWIVNSSLDVKSPALLNTLIVFEVFLLLRLGGPTKGRGAQLSVEMQICRCMCCGMLHVLGLSGTNTAPLF